MILAFKFIKNICFQLILSCFLGYFAAPIKAQNANDDTNYDENSVLFFTKKKCECTTLSFELLQNLIVIPVQINDSDTLKFILDTGARYVIITELNLGQDLHLNYARKTKISGLGKGADIPAYIAHKNTIRIGNLMAENQVVSVLMEDIFLLSKKLGKMIHGILGFHLLKNFKVKIDYVSQKLTICKAESKRFAKEKNWQTLPIELIKEKPYLITRVVFSDEEKREMKLLMDSGAGHALMLSYLQKRNWLDSLPTAYLGRGLNGDLHGKIGYVRHFDLGKTPFNQVTSSFPDSLSLGLSYNYEESQGSIGAEMMRRFDWIIDYSQQKVSFRPNKNIQEKFNYNMSGLEISKPFVNLPVFLVEEVREKSAAALAGVRPGDQIVNFNGKTGSQLSMNLFYKTFHRKSGEKIKITVLRQGVKIKILFLLKN